MSYTNVTPPTFNVNSPDWEKFLDENGYVVFSNILTDVEYNDYFDQFKKDFTSVSPKFNFDNKSDWSIKTAPIMFSKGMGVFSGFGQADFMWKLRLNSNIQAPFKRLYETDDISTSMDGFSVFFSKDQDPKCWHHVDQNPHNHILSYQGQYNFLKCDPQDAGFVIAPGTHKTYKPNVEHNRDWIVLPPSDPYYSKSALIKLVLPKNCFTVWSSKLIHANTGMAKTNNTIHLNRVTCYVAFQPRSNVPETIRQRKIKAYYDADTCSHWANQCVIKKYPFGFGPQYEAKNFNKIVPTLNENGEIPEERLAII